MAKNQSAKTAKKEPSIIFWDCNEQPDFEEINRALAAQFNSKHAPRIYRIEDTGSDQEVIVISGRPLTDHEIEEAFLDEIGPR